MSRFFEDYTFKELVKRLAVYSEESLGIGHWKEAEGRGAALAEGKTLLPCSLPCPLLPCLLPYAYPFHSGVTWLTMGWMFFKWFNLMARTANEYAVYLLLESGHREEVRFPTIQEFQKWYSGELVPKSASNDFISVPIKNIQGEYMVIRPSRIVAIRVEPVFSSSVERFN